MNKNYLIISLFLTTTFLTQAMNDIQQVFKNISEADLTKHFFSINNSKNKIKLFTKKKNKKTDHRPAFYQKFSSRLTTYSGDKSIFSSKKSFCKLAKYGKYKNKSCDCKEHGNSKRVNSWSVEKNGDIKIDSDEIIKNDKYFEAKLSFGGIVRPQGFLTGLNYRYALLMAWYTENKNKDIVNSKFWTTESPKGESDEKVWKYRNNLTLEQSALCVALQHKHFEKQLDNGTPVVIGSHAYAYDVFCSLPMEMQNEIVNNLEWVKLPIFRRVRNIFVNYPILSSITVGGVATVATYKILKKI